MVTEGASFIVITDDDKNRIVVIKHNQAVYDRDLGPYVWGLPGGGIDPGETKEDAGKREAHEESGVIVTNLRELGTFESKVIREGKVLDNQVHLFSSNESSLEEKIRKEATHEVSDIKLVTPVEILEMKDVLMLSALRMILMYMRCRDGIIDTPFSGLYLKDPVDYRPLCLRDRELVVLV